jgi:hypothetical protein
VPDPFSVGVFTLEMARRGIDLEGDERERRECVAMLGVRADSSPDGERRASECGGKVRRDRLSQDLPPEGHRNRYLEGERPEAAVKRAQIAEAHALGELEDECSVAFVLIGEAESLACPRVACVRRKARREFR